MTDQTNLEYKIREILDGEGSAADKIQAIYDDLLPPALPDPLFGARATHPEYGEGIVASHHPHMDGEVFFMFPDEVTADGTNYQWVGHSTLTFHTPDMSKNEAEIDTSAEHVDGIDTKPDHPEFLETEEDYRSAPEGTIVAENRRWPYIAVKSSWSDHPGTYTCHDEMAGIRRRVLRWRWEA